VFVNVLRDAFGQSIATAIAEACRLETVGAKPLSVRTVRRALDMAEKRKAVYQGINFMTAMQFSARRGGPEFAQACREMGIDPRSLGRAARETLDDRFRSLFEAASAGDSIFVELLRARALMTEALRGLSHGAAGKSNSKKQAPAAAVNGKASLSRGAGTAKRARSVAAAKPRKPRT
jgi:hypothetical protein